MPEKLSDTELVLRFPFAVPFMVRPELSVRLKFPLAKFPAFTVPVAVAEVPSANRILTVVIWFDVLCDPDPFVEGSWLLLVWSVADTEAPLELTLEDAVSVELLMVTLPFQLPLRFGA